MTVYVDDILIFIMDDELRRLEKLFFGGLCWR
jgi:hypothetical protein